MHNCLTCAHACHSADFREAYCSAYNTNIHIPLESTECNAYKPRNEKES